MALPNFVHIKDGWPSIDIGAMRHSVNILQLSPSSPPEYDGGGVMLTWNVLFSGLNAAIGAQASGAARGGSDVIHNDQIVSQLFLTVAMWYAQGIEPNMRVVAENGSTYIIQSVENVLEMGVVMVLTCIGIGSND